MIGNFDFLGHNFMSFAFYVCTGYVWLAFICKRLMMEAETNG